MQRSGGFAVIVTQSQQRIENVMVLIVDGAWGAGQGFGQFALEFEQQALGGFLADARNLDQSPDFLPGDGLGQISNR